MNDLLETGLARHLACFDTAALASAYRDQGEFLVVGDFLPPSLLRVWQDELAALTSALNRNFIPFHKKGASLDWTRLAAGAPCVAALYRSREFAGFLESITGVALERCPPSDPHRCALYAYTEPGDWIGWHYDDSWYRGARYTVLIGVEDRSSSFLECRLHTKDPKPIERRAVRTAPGTLVLFNGDTVLHRVTPLGVGERRLVVTMEYVTDRRMGRFARFISNWKDAVGYFGVRNVFFGGSRPVGG